MEIENYPAAYMINWKQHKKGLAGRTMAKKQQQSIELDYEQKRMANLFGKNLTEADGVRRFLAEGCRAANKDGGVSDEEFWRGLFLESKVNGKYGNNLLRENKYDGYPNKVPSDPYSAIDYQCTLKYLAHGHERVFDKKKPDEHPIDSENFFRYFNLMDNTESYTSNLKTAIHLRNKYSHDTIEGIQNITADSLKQDIQLLQRITVPLCKKEDFPFADEIRAYWKRIEEEYHRKFSAPPIDLDDAACVVFRTDELTLEQIAAVKDVIRSYNINEKDGKIYEYPDRTKLEELLSYSMLRPRGSEEERRQLAEQTEKRSKKRRETTEKLEKLFHEEIRRVTTQGLSEQEFTDAKAAILYRLDSSMQSPDKRLAAAVTGEFTGKGYQEAARKRETLEKLTLKEVNRIIKKYLSVPGKVTVLVTPEKR